MRSRHVGRVLVGAAILMLVPMSSAQARLRSAIACETHIEPTPADQLPRDVRTEFGNGARVRGSGGLWVLVDSAERPPVFDVDNDRWAVNKVVWWRLGDEQIEITGHRRDGSGTVDASTGNIIGVPRVVPSSITFSGGGCWKVAARVGDWTVRFTVRVPRGTDGICASIASELKGLRSIQNPENDATAARYENFARGRGCAVT